MRRALACAGLTAAATLAACGGDDSGVGASTQASGGPPYTAARLAACLRRTAPALPRTRTSTTVGLDSVAKGASDGAVEVRFDVAPGFPRGIGGAAVVVEATVPAAKATEQTYAAIFRRLGAPPTGRLIRKDNAVVAFEGQPTARQRALIDGCLRSGRRAP